MPLRILSLRYLLEGLLLLPVPPVDGTSGREVLAALGATLLEHLAASQ